MYNGKREGNTMIIDEGSLRVRSRFLIPGHKINDYGRDRVELGG